MTKEERKSYAHCIMSMCTDFLMGGLTWETWLSNLKVITTKIENLEKLKKLERLEKLENVFEVPK